jgi:hypothetical protein
MTDFSDNFMAALLDHADAQKLAAFLTTYNQASQALAITAVDPATTGTEKMVINGVPITCIVEDDADWSSVLEADLVQGDAKGVVIPNLYSQWLIVYANAAGRLRIDLAGDMALDANVELKIPMYDPTVWCPIALLLVDSTGATLGTTDIGASMIGTEYQVIGPVLPHPDNLK